MKKDYTIAVAGTGYILKNKVCLGLKIVALG